MVSVVKNSIDLIRNMGFKYVTFRLWYMAKLKSGVFKMKFPQRVALKTYISLDEWKKSNSKFFFDAKSSIQFPKKKSSELQEWYVNFKKGQLIFFNSSPYSVTEDDWITNPETGYRYDVTKHWTEIPDYSKEAGDIKYVWEKSRFTYLYYLIRYDYHYEDDTAGIVLKEILSWIDYNPINCGPNYRCSQEISLRILNWTFALYYYKNSKLLTETVFQKIIHSIYWQAKHVYENIHFSRIAVRNNHAITETLGIYLFGLLFPFFPESDKWRRRGKKWFQEEIKYQIYPDGTYLQFSMNYHRVVIQLLTWGIRLSQLNDEKLDEVIIARANASLGFLFNCMDKRSGHLPNYGANDGSLFFPLNNNDFRDYRPQLQALSLIVKEKYFQGDFEDHCWYGLKNKSENYDLKNEEISSYPDGGYYLLRHQNTFTFIRCGNHKDRPSQADNLHLDLWLNGHNILVDGGSYKYNTDEKTLKYFFGTASHNTVMLDDHDQMKKGRRFIWYYWTQKLKASWKEYEDYYEFAGSISAFRHLSNDIVHNRTVRKYKSNLRWEVTDEILNKQNLSIKQIWHPLPPDSIALTFKSFDEHDNNIQCKKSTGWYSPNYGKKIENDLVIFSTRTNKIRTTIEAKINSG